MTTTSKKTEVRIFARDLVELLAGRITQDEQGPPHVELEITPEDDDWISFTFQGPDPALSPFYEVAKRRKSK